MMQVNVVSLRALLDGGRYVHILLKFIKIWGKKKLGKCTQTSTVV